MTIGYYHLDVSAYILTAAYPGLILIFKRNSVNKHVAIFLAPQGIESRVYFGWHRLLRRPSHSPLNTQIDSRRWLLSVETYRAQTTILDGLGSLRGPLSTPIHRKSSKDGALGLRSVFGMTDQA